MNTNLIDHRMKVLFLRDMAANKIEEFASIFDEVLDGYQQRLRLVEGIQKFCDEHEGSSSSVKQVISALRETVETLDQSGKIEVCGSFGSFFVDRDTGFVFLSKGSKEPLFGECEGINRVDINEYESFYDRKIPNSVDILDLGCWKVDGSYEEPANEWRNEARELDAA